MPEENKPAEETTGGSTDGNTSIDRAEFEQAQAKATTLDQMEADAVELGFTSVQEEVEWLLEEEGKRQQEAKPTGEAKPVLKAPEPKPNSDDRTSEMDAIRKELNEQKQQNAHVVAFAQCSAYEAEQRGLPEDQRDGFTQEELNNVVFGHYGQVAKELATDKKLPFKGNLYAAAADILKTKKGAPTIRQEGAKAEANRAAAASSASTEAGGKMPDEKEQTYSQKMADMIAPDDDAIYATDKG